MTEIDEEWGRIMKNEGEWGRMMNNNKGDGDRDLIVWLEIWTGRWALVKYTANEMK